MYVAKNGTLDLFQKGMDNNFFPDSSKMRLTQLNLYCKIENMGIRDIQT